MPSMKVQAAIAVSYKRLFPAYYADGLTLPHQPLPFRIGRDAETEYVVRLLKFDEAALKLEAELQIDREEKRSCRKIYTKQTKDDE